MAQPYYINPALAIPFIRQYREWDWWDARGKQECESEYLPQVAVQDTQMRPGGAVAEAKFGVCTGLRAWH